MRILEYTATAPSYTLMLALHALPLVFPKGVDFTTASGDVLTYFPPNNKYLLRIKYKAALIPSEMHFLLLNK